MAAAKLMPTAARAIIRTASFPRRRPKTPFTNAPRSGISRTTAMSEKSFALKSSRIALPMMSSSVLQEVRFVRSDGAPDTEERKDDRETDGDLGGLGGDDEEGEDLP